jgi:ER lumen protein retaining receptor
MMNIFRFIGDMAHVASIVVLLLRIQAMKNARGISIKTQELYFIVFAARYLDLFTHFYSLYNSSMKVLYLSSTAYIIYIVRKTDPYKSDYDDAQDSFKHIHFGVAPCAVLGLLTCFWKWEWGIETFRIFSLYLESIAIVPQLIMIQRYKEVENLTSHYVALLGCYRGFYILNWVWRTYNEKYYEQDWVAYSCGAIQTLLYLDFFYYYAMAVMQSRKMALPK